MGSLTRGADKSHLNRINYVERTMQKELPECFETYQKIKRIDALPTLWECRRMINQVDWRFGPATYMSLLVKNDYFQIVHANLVRDLARVIRAIGSKKNVEIAAGRGKLSYWLNQRGIEIFATDSWKEIKSKGVEKLNHRQALEKYNPEFVLVASPPSLEMVIDVLGHESVRHIIVLKKGAALMADYKRELLRGLAKSVEVLAINTYPSAIDSLMGMDRDEKGNPVTVVGGKEKSLNNFYKSVLVTTKRE